ncbi:unnamed protein product [Triticum turgidum subsp. durum]|uniref:Uncharacterized protein n=1 Tax=Triticum turgidum subsp. durum TaxID=4567 RepID=A0A9R1PX80_TRITD|nr:unnamed protein product [Triticum turgidum subsp. durum]
MHRFSSALVFLQNLPSHTAMKLPLFSLEALRITKEMVKHFHEFVSTRLGSLSKCTADLFRRSYLFLVFKSNPLVVQLIYLMSISFAGFLALKNLAPLNKPSPRNLDLIFTSVSTVTVSSMATIEMEDFSGQQLWVFIILMILGGEVFTSMVGLHFKNARANTEGALQTRLAFISRDIESSDDFNNSSQNYMEGIQPEETMPHNQILVGNTLFAPLLRLSIWTLGKLSSREEYAYILQHPKEIGYRHLQPHKNSVQLVLTGVMLILLQAMLICYFEWDSKSLEGMGWFQKLIGSLFQSANSRHAGETVIDISTLSPPIMVIFALVMYLPSGTSILATCGDNRSLADKKENPNGRATWKKFAMTKRTCLVIITILACITERKSMTADPLNFSIFSVIFEVMSAYGNVGYSLGYSCDKLLRPDSACRDASYGFVGRWSDKGRLIIILVMFLGRFKAYTLKGKKTLNVHPCRRTAPHQRPEVAGN